MGNSHSGHGLYTPTSLLPLSLDPQLQSQYHVTPLDPETLTQEVVKLVFDSFGGRSALMNAMHPHVDMPEGLAKTHQRYLTMLRNGYAQRWVKATGEGGELVGASQWYVYDGERPKEKELDGPVGGKDGIWDNEEDREWAKALYGSLMGYRWPVMRKIKGPVICLLKMTVKEDCQRQGVGSLMMEWGMDVADAIDAECIVESTEEGRRLYEKFGFRVLHDVVLEVPEKFRDRQKQRLFVMHRGKRSDKENWTVGVAESGV